ncbi:Mut7-C RNAse domain-containing protein [Lysobacter korlensis]|uniref:Mut7-C RNAse domain-containing protein n=1 Tax=Lysobacter korlensis TaxID=553636 RepID=A0ABV6RM51_9GAMM
MPRVLVEVDPSLRALLPRRERSGRLGREVATTETVAHLLQSVGVPRTEVGEVLIDGRRVERDALRTTHLLDAATAVVRARRRPQRHSGRFLLDVHLGALARRMRLLGVDVAYDPGADDPELAERSAADGRVLLTRDRGLLFRSAVPDGALLRSDDVDEQLRDMLDRFALELTPWGRCLRCGAVLTRVSAAEVAAELEHGTRRTYCSFSRCTGCSQVYWRGAHSRRLDAIVEGARKPDGRRITENRHTGDR